MSVDTSWCLRWMSVMVWHLMSLEVVVCIFMDGIMLLVLFSGPLL